MSTVSPDGMLMVEVSGGRVRGRQRLGRMDGVKMALSNKGMTVVERKEWIALGICKRMSFTRPLCLALCFFGPPFRALVVIT